jgi:hypothetical protein
MHGGAHPATYAEKTAFRSMVQDAMRKDNPEGGEENFEEAVAAVLKTMIPPSLPSGLREVFGYKRTNAVRHTIPNSNTYEAYCRPLTRIRSLNKTRVSGPLPTP